jgi:ATP-binding cassette subfamily B protein RaxB
MQFPIHSSFVFWATRRLPVLLQTEGAECGLTCIAMVASYWGHQIDLPSMRRRFSVSMKGVNLKGLMAIASGLSLQTRPLKLELQHLPELKLPCILHWNLNHFVVLKSVSVNHAVVHDPAVGEQRMTLGELAKHFTGIALELTPTAQFENKEERQQISLSSLMGRVVGLRRGLFQILSLGLALQVCALIAPFYMQWIVDEALLAADRDLITVLGCGFLLLVLFQTSIGAVRSWVTTVLATSLNLPYFEKRHTGDIVSRFSSIQKIQTSLTTQFVEGIIDGVLVLGTLVMMLLYSYTLAGVACTAVLLYAILRCIMFRPLRNANSEQIIHAAKQQSHFIETVRGMQSIRLFGRSEERRSGWMNSLTDEFNAQLRIAKLSVSYQTANALLFE